MRIKWINLPGVVTVAVEGTDCMEHSRAAAAVEFQDFAEEAHEEIVLVVDPDLNEALD